jgi:hypothetical protein
VRGVVGVFFFLLLIAFLVYLYFTNGEIHIKNKHFEISLSKNAIMEAINKNKPKHVCANCGRPIQEDKIICDKCQEDELDIYSSSSMEDINVERENTFVQRYKRL